MKSGYKYVKENFQKHEKEYNTPDWNRGVEFRKGQSVVRAENPTKIHRARELGYKAKQGYIIARVRIRKGGLHKTRPKRGRKNRAMGVVRFTPDKNLRWISEERAQKKFPNLEVLNSYKVYSDGKHWYYEVIMVDPHHPVIKSDPKINWICQSSEKNRVNRGKTSAGKKSRGLHKRGWGSERTRPSKNK